MTDLSIVTANTYSRGEGIKKDIHAPDHTGEASARRQVAREMESLFAYQLLKIMRETVNSLSDENKGIGHDTYSGLFDMEISRLLSERGIGLQDSIVQWLERTPDAVQTENEER